MESFTELPLVSSLQQALSALHYTTPTPVQYRAIPELLKGRDMLGTAETGSGKTASFALPLLQRVLESKKDDKRQKQRKIRALVLAPTRELASQVAESFGQYGQFTNLRYGVVYGGVKYARQIKVLKSGVDILVATPGRLIDLISQGHIDLRDASFLVLDEADRMLDMGFKHDLEKIVGLLPESRQTILFSATMPDEVRRFAKRILRDSLEIDVVGPKKTLATIEEKILFVKTDAKNDALFELLQGKEVERAIIFTRTKYSADKLAKKLVAKKVRAEAIHGDKRQNVRERSLRKFREGGIRVLVATDVAARGIDVDNVTHVINYQLSDDPESYTHRIGRTARAGRSGTAYTLCSNEELGMLNSIEKELRRSIDVGADLPFFDSELAQRYAASKIKRGKPGRKPARNRPSAGGSSKFDRTKPQRRRNRGPRRPHKAKV